MAGWSTHKGCMITLSQANIDTDQLIPSRFMSVPRSEGYQDYLLHDLRRMADGSLDPDFPLNHKTQASILLAGANFGSGSSREAAVYALIDAGFHAVIAPSFGDIFSSNAVNNGLFPACVNEADWKILNNSTGKVQIDLTAGTITIGNTEVSFTIEYSWRIKLINGWDDIDLTKQHVSEIAAYKTLRHQITPWAWPARVD